jgi:1,2-diacylglycerol 3-alpha-glucosyltransferase
MSLETIRWAKKKGVRLVVMSETRLRDGSRYPLGESVKKRIVSMCDAGLCGGESHRRYLEELGLPKDRVALGYNAVDNQFFSKTRNEKGFSVGDSERAQIPTPYFLASNRFVERKNLRRLVEAYARYAGSFKKSEKKWPLLLLGNGEQCLELMERCKELGLSVANFENTNQLKLQIPAGEGCVAFAGFRQIKELPFFYGGAGAFIHPALSEPWGLVINEAMASGLPILSSKNVGAAEELVRDGINGFTFDPEKVNELVGLLLKMAEMRQEERKTLGEASRRMIADWGPERFAQGAEYAARAAMSAPQKRFSIIDRILLEILIRK